MWSALVYYIVRRMMEKYWVNNISGNIEVVFFMCIWHPQCHRHGNFLRPSLFLSETKYPHFQPLKVGQRVLLETGPWSRQKQGISVLIKTAKQVLFFSFSFQLQTSWHNHFPNLHYTKKAVSNWKIYSKKETPNFCILKSVASMQKKTVIYS